MKGPDGKQYATKINTISNGGVLISGKTEYPEVCMRTIDGPLRRKSPSVPVSEKKIKIGRWRKPVRSRRTDNRLNTIRSILAAPMIRIKSLPTPYGLCNNTCAVIL
ncbi:MAG: hypothetical protein ACLR23_26750 [Clostridia bacterium]